VLRSFAASNRVLQAEPFTAHRAYSGQRIISRTVRMSGTHVPLLKRVGEVWRGGRDHLVFRIVAEHAPTMVQPATAPECQQCAWS
jgi:hypothetical protein